MTEYLFGGWDAYNKKPKTINNEENALLEQKHINSLVEKAKKAEFSDYVGAEQAIMGISAILSTAEKMGMKAAAKSAQKAVDKAFLALSKYDNWDYAGFKTAVGMIKPIQ